MKPWSIIRRTAPAAAATMAMLALLFTAPCPPALAQDAEPSPDATTVVPGTAETTQEQPGAQAPDGNMPQQETAQELQQETIHEPQQQTVQEDTSDPAQATDTTPAMDAYDMPDTSGVLENPRHMWNGQDGGTDGTDGDPSRPRSRARAQSRTQWTTRNGVKTFLHGNGEVFASPAAHVIDVSEWQKDIDWNKVKQSGVDGVILRLGYCNNLDKRFERNLSEVRRLKIPYGIYLFSYADNSKWGTIEANFVAQQMQRYNLTDMAYPVFYDLEDWKPWTGDDGTHSAPTSAAQYHTVVSAFTDTMAKHGYRDVQVYSYLNYLKTVLNHPDILALAGWVAQYNTRCDYTFPYYTGARGWQYTSSGSVDGIIGNVDMNAFAVDTNSPNTPGSVVVDGVRIPSKDYTGWITQQGDTYWFDSGRMAKNKEVRISGSWYWFDADGTRTYGVRWLNSSGGKWVYYDIFSGKMQYGEQYLNYDREHTGWYYFEPGTGKMAHGVRWINSNGGKWVYYHIASGKMQYGEQYLNYDREHTGWYYFEPGTGKMAHGTVQVNGKTAHYDKVTGQRR